LAAPILPISAPAITALPSTAGATSQGSGEFAGMLSAAIGSVEGLGRQAGASVERFLSGEGEDLHTAVLAATRAELAFDLFLESRNKVVSAYQEIMRMQL
jgi:flagellar hook-basal body complex protein FliE